MKTKYQIAFEKMRWIEQFINNFKVVTHKMRFLISHKNMWANRNKKAIKEGYTFQPIKKTEQEIIEGSKILDRLIRDIPKDLKSYHKIKNGTSKNH